MADITDIYELSPMQKGMLFHSLYEPRSGTYFEQCWCLLEGALDAEAFQRAWQTAMDRHEVLRTEFHWREVDNPVQVVYATASAPWTLLDWRGQGEPWQARELEALLEADRQRGLALDEAPLLRFTLIDIGAGRHRFVWSYHHILMDGWCAALIVKEVLEIYAAAPQPAPRRPYRDYIAWLQQQDHSEAERYWRDTLQGFSEPTPVGIDQVAGGGGGVLHEIRTVLSAEFSAALKDFARRSRLTLNTLIQGAWALMLSRYSGRADIVFGATVSGRPPSLAGAESMVGLFVNTVPVRVDTGGTQALLPWLRDLQSRQRERECFGYCALTDIQGWSQVPRGTPLFETLVIFENYPLSMNAAVAGAQNRLQIKEAGNFERTHFPLSLKVIPGAEITLCVGFAADRVAESAGARVPAHLENILRGFIEPIAVAFFQGQEPAGVERALPEDAAEKTLQRIEMLSDGERRLLQEGGQGREVDIESIPIHRWIQRQAQRRPEAVAVRFLAGDGDAEAGLPGGATLTYGALNDRANRLAHHLIGRGVSKHTMVGICLRRSADLIVSLLAVLKTGAAYVPIDPDYPAERVRMILEDAQIGLLLSDRNEWPGPGDGDVAGVEAVLLPEIEPILALGESCDPDIAVAGEDLAYMIFTSGSTGRPKGVPISHRSLTNFIASMRREPGVAESDVVMAVTTIAFDIAALEIFAPLASGATVLLASASLARDGEQLLRQLRAQGATLMQATPAGWRLLVESGWEQANWPQQARLKMLCGGEALDVPLARQLLAGGGELWNMYGPTEATIWSGALKISAGQLAGSVVPVGNPIDNTRFYVLDEQCSPVPPGVSGELYIGGAGLSPGYWCNPQLTAEKFVRDPFAAGDRADARLYRTGDSVRYRDDGTLEFLGRLDGQIKLRGYRIETAEIEAALLAHGDVVQAVVAVRQGRAGNPCLVAYLRCGERQRRRAPDDKALQEELKNSLAKTLPAYMLPGAYCVVERFPLTPNGKVDRKALPAVAATAPAVAAGRRHSPLQQLIAGIWAAVLPIEGKVPAGEPGPEDNFFDLGGHSLLATRAIGRIQNSVGVELPLRTLFERPLLADFAEAVEQALAGARERPQRPPLVRDNQGNHPPLSYAQQRQWVLARLDPHSSAYVIPAAVKLHGQLDAAAAQHSLAALVRRHGVLRSCYPDVDGEATVRVLPHLDVRLVAEDFSTLPEAEKTQAVDEILRRAAATPFDLSTAPLWRAQLLRLGEREHVLVLTLHHIIADEWSLGLLIDEFLRGYRDHLSAADAPPAPPLPVQYTDYAAWQRALDFSGQRGYWQRQLAGAPELLELPADFPRPALRGDSGASLAFALTEEQCRAAQSLCRQLNVTPFMFLLTVFGVLLHRYTGREDINIGTPVANRQPLELEALIGLFVNTVVIRADLSGNPVFDDLLAQVRSTVLDAHAHADLPFEQLLEALNIRRNTGYSPLFQVFFAMQHLPDQGAPAGESRPDAGGDLRWSILPSAAATAKFDLSLTLRDTGGNWSGVFEYSTELFRAATIERFAGDYIRLVEAFCLDADARIAAVETSIGADRRGPAAGNIRSDRKAPAESVRRKTHAPARTREEKLLADIWASVLKVERVGRDDNFFELGGDSVLVMRIVSRAAAAGLSLKPRQLFQHQTLAELAAVACPAADRPATGGESRSGVSGGSPAPFDLVDFDQVSMDAVLEQVSFE